MQEASSHAVRRPTLHYIIARNLFPHPAAPLEAKVALLLGDPRDARFHRSELRSSRFNAPLRGNKNGLSNINLL